MTLNGSRIIEQREQVLADAFTGLGADLKNISPGQFDLFFNHGQPTDLAHHLDQLASKHFATNALQFTYTGNCELSWEGAPVVRIDFEFQFAGVFAFFRLTLGEKLNSTELHYISFDNQLSDTDGNTYALVQALEQAQA